MIAKGVRASQDITLTVPVLVNHHHSEEHAKLEEEDAIDVVRDGIADRDAEGEEDDAANNVEGNAEQDVANDPAVVKSADHQDQLRYRIDEHNEDGVTQVGKEQSHSVGLAETTPVLESTCRDDEADSTDTETAKTKKLSSQHMI